jgi:hypothetical protein
MRTTTGGAARRRLLLLLFSLGAIFGPGAQTATAAQASVYSNITAFAYACDGTSDTYSQKVYDLAVSGYKYLGYGTTGYTGTGFTSSRVLARVPLDTAFYVHSHGDYYGSTDTQGFRIDGGYCTGAPIVNSRNIDAKRGAQVAQVVIVSTCFLGENPPTGTDQLSMAEAFGIAQVQNSSGGWRFYMGYTSEPVTSDEWAFESKFWSYVKAGGATFKPIYSLADAYSMARADVGTFTKLSSVPVQPVPKWYGNPYYTGWWDIASGCPNCS